MFFFACTKELPRSITESSSIFPSATERFACRLHIFHFISPIHRAKLAFPKGDNEKSHKITFRGKEHTQNGIIELLDHQCTFIWYYDTGNACHFHRRDGLEHSFACLSTFVTFGCAEKNLFGLPECLAIHGIVKLVTLFFHFRSIADRESQSQSFNLIFFRFRFHSANFSHIADFPVNFYFNLRFTFFCF